MAPRSDWTDAGDCVNVALLTRAVSHLYSVSVEIKDLCNTDITCLSCLHHSFLFDGPVITVAFYIISRGYRRALFNFTSRHMSSHLSWMQKVTC